MKLKRLVAGILSAAMLLSVSSTLAFAEDTVEDTSVDSIDFTTTMYIGATAITAPAFNYTYTLAATTATEKFETADSTTYVYPGVGVDNITVALAAGETANAFAAGVYTNSAKTVTYTIDFTSVASVVDHAGIYHYTLTESGEDGADAVDGVVNQTDREYDIYVTVSNTAAGGFVVTDVDMYIDAIALDTDGDSYATATKAKGFTHTYGIEAGDDDNPDPGNGKTQDFIVTDIAKGDMANKLKEFSFATVIVENEDLEGMVFAVENGVLANADGSDGTQAISYVYVGDSGVLYLSDADYSTSGTTKAVFALASGESFTIKNVIEGMSFQVLISDPLNEGYDFYARSYDAEYASTYNADDDTTWNTWYALDAVAADDGVVAVATYQEAVDEDYDTLEGIDFATVNGSKAGEGDDKDIEYNNTNFPDTGVVLDLAPYAIMMMLAVGAIAFRFVNVARKTEE